MRGMNEMVRQAQIMQRKLATLQEELKDRPVEAASGGGMVKVTATCGGDLTAVVIDKSVVEAGDVDMLQDLVLAAANEALKKGREEMEREMSQLTGGLKIPGLF
ncbi:MAG: YbaB/EbfC family nucleoid-associated protein [Desulfovibrionaceae bacterium]